MMASWIVEPSYWIRLYPGHQAYGDFPWHEIVKAQRRDEDVMMI
jgi:hypothetical protein